MTESEKVLLGTTLFITIALLIILITELLFVFCM